MTLPSRPPVSKQIRNKPGRPFASVITVPIRPVRTSSVHARSARFGVTMKVFAAGISIGSNPDSRVQGLAKATFRNHADRATSSAATDGTLTSALVGWRPEAYVELPRFERHLKASGRHQTPHARRQLLRIAASPSKWCERRSCKVPLTARACQATFPLSNKLYMRKGE